MVLDGDSVTSPAPPDLQVLLLEDLLVLLQKQDDKLLLKCHSKTAGGPVDGRQTFSPVLKLNAVLVRSVATGAGAVVAWADLGSFPSRPTPSKRRMWSKVGQEGCTVSPRTKPPAAGVTQCVRGRSGAGARPPRPWARSPHPQLGVVPTLFSRGKKGTGTSSP